MATMALLTPEEDDDKEPTTAERSGIVRLIGHKALGFRRTGDDYTLEGVENIYIKPLKHFSKHI